MSPQNTFLPRHDPLLCFLHKIGPENASKVLRITIEGDFTPLRPFGLPNPTNPSPGIGFAGILSMHTLVLNIVCPNLRSLTLHMAGGTSTKRAHLWGYDVDQGSGKTNEQKLDETVGKVVEGLPNLQHLQLGNYKFGQHTFFSGAGDPFSGGSIVISGLNSLVLMFPDVVNPHDQIPNGPDEWSKSVRWMGTVAERPEKPRRSDPRATVSPLVG